MKPFFFLAAMVALLASCGNSQKSNGQSVDSVNTETVADTVATAAIAGVETDETATDQHAIRIIREEWAAVTDNDSRQIKVGQTQLKDKVSRFAVAFANAYPQLETNKQLAAYLQDPTGYKNDLYGFNYQPRNGYVECQQRTEVASCTAVCYWNRKIGNQLVAIYMEDNREGYHDSDHLVVFYNYDPALDTLSPDPSLTDMIEERVKGYDAYYVALPQKGKDITVRGYRFDQVNDNAEIDEMKLIWDGSSFSWEGK